MSVKTAAQNAVLNVLFPKKKANAKRSAELNYDHLFDFIK
jgi:hypothetical protein